MSFKTMDAALNFLIGKNSRKSFKTELLCLLSGSRNPRYASSSSLKAGKEILFLQSYEQIQRSKKLTCDQYLMQPRIKTKNLCLNIHTKRTGK